MSSSQLSGALYKSIEKQGFQGQIVSIAHLEELQKDIEAHHKKGLLDKELYDAYLASFDFECQHQLAGAQSLIIISMPQPQVRIMFTREDKSYPVIIPPTYNFSGDDQVADLLAAHLGPQGYRLQKVRLPQKLLAVRSGLAQYGKNNITYVKGSGSFHRPVVFISDFPCEADSWREPAVLEQCDKCSACAKACPSAAVGSDRFLLHAERCLTFLNERPKDFPGWLSPAWHNSLVGCMICQKVCPANKNALKWTESGATFDNVETDHILNGVSEEQLPKETFEKLKKHGMMAYYDVVGRNLKTLIEKPIEKAIRKHAFFAVPGPGHSNLTGQREFGSLKNQSHLILTRLHRGGDMVKKRLQLVALLCCFLIGLSACSRKWAVIGAAAAAVGTGAYFYIKGDLTRNYEASMDKTWEATIKSVEALKLSVESQKHDALTGVIKGKMADEKGFEINLKRVGEDLTEVGVRIGTFGDRERSEAIHNKIHSML